jgi:hypothetical protein
MFIVKAIDVNSLVFYLYDFVCDCSFATCAATTNADHEWLHKLTLAIIPG